MNRASLRKRSLRRIAYALAALAVVAGPGGASPSKAPAKLEGPAPLVKADKQSGVQLSRLPLYFEPNVGQADPAVRFISRGGGFTTYLTGSEAVFLNAALTTPLRLKFRNTLPVQTIEPADKLPGISNYFYGKDPSKWRTDVPHFAKVLFREVYAGVDVVFYSGEKRLEYDFILKPGADPSAIEFAWEGAAGTKLDQNGDLILQTSAGEIRQRRPVVYQETNGKRAAIQASYRINGEGHIGFELAAYQRDLPLVIDPQIFYSTYLGGNNLDDAYTMTADPSGAVYITGYTGSTNFPRFNAYQSTRDGLNDVFVTKIAVGGSALVYSTYIGGESEDRAYGIAADGQGNAYITGITASFGYPTTANTYLPNFTGVQDAFVTKLSPLGNTLAYSTFVGTDGYEIGFNVVVDRTGSAVMAGTTNSPGLAVTANAFQKTFGGGQEMFLIRLDPQGRTAPWLTYFGGNLDDTPTSMLLDLGGEIYLGGYTSSTNFPTTATAFRRTASGLQDGFFAKISQRGDRLVMSSLIGGISFDYVNSLALEPGGRILLSGFTSSADFPTTASAYQRTLRGNYDAFVCRFNSTGTLLIASTFFGTASLDQATGVLPGAGGHLIIAGYTESNNFTSTSDAFGFSANNFGDAFLTILRPLADSLHFSSVVGGNQTDIAKSMTQDAAGDIYLTGQTYSADFPTTGGAFSTTNSGSPDGFVTRITNLNVPDCTSAATPTGTTYEVTGGGGGVGLIGACNWWAFASVPWITLTTSPLLTGNGSLNYTVANHAGVEPRTGAVQTAGNLVQILQRGTTTVPPFGDVPVNDPFIDYIRIIKANAVTSGCTTTNYCPSENTTRGQMAVFIVRSLLGTDNFDVPAIQYFNDVTPAHPQFKWIQKLRELNITTGCNLVEYCPNDPVTRGQMAAFVVRAKFGSNFTYPTTPYFQDVPANHPFFNFVQKLRQVGITTGCNANQYCVNDNNTRGQMAVFLTRMFFTPW